MRILLFIVYFKNADFHKIELKRFHYLKFGLKYIKMYKISTNKNSLKYSTKFHGKIPRKN